MAALIKKSVVFDLTTPEGRVAFDKHRAEFYEDYLWETMEEARAQLFKKWRNHPEWETEILEF